MRVFLFFVLFSFSMVSLASEDLREIESSKKIPITHPVNNANFDDVGCVVSAARSLKNDLWSCMKYLTMFLAVQSSIKPVSGFTESPRFLFDGEVVVARELSGFFRQDWQLFTNIIEYPPVSQVIGRYSVKLDRDAIPFVVFRDKKKEYPYYTYSDVLHNMVCCEVEECGGITIKNITLSDAQKTTSLRYRGKQKKIDVLQVDIDFIPSFEQITCTSIEKARFYIKFKED